MNRNVDKLCCMNCFSEIEIQRFIEEFDELGDCGYCGSEEIYVCEVDEVGEFIQNGIDRYYEDAAKMVSYESAEGGHPFDTMDIHDILLYEQEIFSNIQKAAEVVNAGDIVLVKQGTYPGFWIQNKHGRAENWIVFKPYPGHQVTLDSYTNNYATTWRAVQITGSSYIEINGFKMTDSNPLYDSQRFEDYSKGQSHNGIKLEEAGDGTPPSYIRIINNHIYRTGDNGILSSGHHNEFINNHLEEIGKNKQGYGMYIGGDDQIIRGNIIHAAYGYGIHLYSATGPKRNLIENNILYRNGRSDFSKGWDWRGCKENGCSYGDGIIVWGGSDNIIRNNISYDNRLAGITVYSQNSLVVNNTCYNNKGSGGESPGIGVAENKNSIVRNNISYQNSGGDYNIGPGNTQDHNLFSMDPKFMDAANGDFRLQAGSPAIDAGIAISGFATDRDGASRPQGSGWDIGAYEFGGTLTLKAHLSANPTSGLAPLTVNFSGNASGGKAPYSYSWNFGDGNTSTQQNPMHTYAQANSYTATLTLIDNNNKRAIASQTIIVVARSGNAPSVVNTRFTEVDQAKELLSIIAENWYDLYLYLDAPQGWNDINKVDFWLSHEPNKNGTILNHGGTYSAVSNYVISCAVNRDMIWAKQTEGTADWTEITGRLGLYVDDDNNEHEQNSMEKWAKVRIKLLANAQTGNWTINAYVIDKEGHIAHLFRKSIRVSNAVDQTPPSPPQNVRVGIGSP